MPADAFPSSLPEISTVLSDEDRLGPIRETGLLEEDTGENFDRLTR